MDKSGFCRIRFQYILIGQSPNLTHLEPNWAHIYQAWYTAHTYLTWHLQSHLPPRYLPPDTRSPSSLPGAKIDQLQTRYHLTRQIRDFFYRWVCLILCYANKKMSNPLMFENASLSHFYIGSICATLAPCLTRRVACPTFLYSYPG